ncbi:MAG: transposase [Candidatus Fermentibacteraceae bacterium]|nr:transposase [Candidatus Fermentibacteraceae bacterium]
MITHVVKQIRKHYSKDVPIILRCDAGFFDQKLFRCFQGLDIGILCGGKHYADINELAGSVKLEHWEQYKKGEGEKARVWSYYEFGDRRGTWKIDEFLRAFYCTQETEENGQYLMEFVKHDSIIYTNLGMGRKIDEQLINTGHGDMLKAGMIIETYFGRGNDELVNRAFKNFVSQKLPFKRFNMNATYYYLSMTAFLLLEAQRLSIISGSAPSDSTKHLSMMSVMTSFQYHPTPPRYADNYSTMPEK